MFLPMGLMSPVAAPCTTIITGGRSPGDSLGYKGLVQIGWETWKIDEDGENQGINMPLGASLQESLNGAKKAA